MWCPMVVPWFLWYTRTDSALAQVPENSWLSHVFAAPCWSPAPYLTFPVAALISWWPWRLSNADTKPALLVDPRASRSLMLAWPASADVTVGIMLAVVSATLALGALP